MPTRRTLLTAVIPVLLGAARAPRRVLTAADVHSNGYPTVEAMKYIGDRLSAATDGRLALRVYHSGQLGRESDSIDTVRFGGIDLTRVNFGPLNNPFPSTRLAILPFVFDSVAHMRRSIDGEPGRLIRADFARRGLVCLCIYDAGERCLYNTRRPIESPEDLAGLKIRVPPSDVFLDMGAALGANPTPLAYGEVYSALQTRLIDGAENNVRSFHSSRQFEVARYWSQTNHSYAPDALITSQRLLDALGPAVAQALSAAASDSVAYMRRLWDADVERSMAAVVESGVRINRVDVQAFRRACSPLLKRYLAEPAQRRLYGTIRELA